MDSQTVKAGLLMEAAAAQQQLAEEAVERLEALSRSLEPTVRQSVGDAAAQAVSQAAQAEFARLRAETQRTAQALNGIRSGLSWNLAALGCLIGAVMGAVLLAGLVALGVPGAVAQPGAAGPAAPSGLRGDPAVLSEFAKRGLQVEVSLCGPTRQPCARVDPKGQTFVTGSGSRRETYLVVPTK